LAVTILSAWSKNIFKKNVAGIKLKVRPIPAR